MTAIATVGLTKAYPVGFWRPRPVLALDALTLQVGTGQVFGLLGPNGAGKTTTMKLLMGLVHPTSGSASLLGAPLTDVAVRGRIGYLPEQPYFYDYLTAEELLTYIGGLYGLRGADLRARVARRLDEAGLEAARRRPLRTYSKGMLQRVGLAQALLHDPELVILDEPMSGLDPIGRRDVRTLILRLRQEGRTVLFSSHVLSDAEAVCSEVAILAKGRLVMHGPLSQFADTPVRGWEVVATGVRADAAATLSAQAAQTHALGQGRYAFDLPEGASPEAFVAALRTSGGALVSVTPVRESLEAVFLRHVVGVGEGSGRHAAPGASTAHAAPSGEAR